MESQEIRQLLHAWINMTVCIRGNRFVAGLSFNEMVISHYLYRALEEGIPSLTAAQLGRDTHLLKSQMNQLLTRMEKRELITRTRNSGDRRKIDIALSEKGKADYLKEHVVIEQLLEQVALGMGSKKIHDLSELLDQATTLLDQQNI